MNSPRDSRSLDQTDHNREIPSRDFSAGDSARAAQSLTPILDEDGTADRMSWEELRRAHDLLEFHLNNTPLALLQWNHEMKLIAWSKRAERLFGWSRQDVLGKHLTDFPLIYPEDAPTVLELLERLRKGELPVGTNVNRNGTKDGRVIYCEWHNSIYLNDDGSVNSVFSLAQDVTERREAEISLQEVTTRLQGILDNSPLLIADLDLDGRYRVANRAICDLLGKRAEELIGRRFHEFLPRETADLFVSRLRKVHATKQVLNVEDHVELQGVSKTMETILFPLFRDDGENIVSVGSITHDISDRREAEVERERLESHLRQAQKLEAVGRLAGGVAHDFNNMLGVILGHADMVLDTMSPTDPHFAHLSEIRTAARRSADLTQQLLVFARQQAITPKVLDLNHVVSGLLKMLRHLIGEDIELQWIPGNDLGMIRADSSQLDQVLANLVVNARDAITETGTITLSTSNVELSDEFCETHVGAIPGRYVCLTIHDTGCGMSEKVQAQIFEPFFTTKPQGKGTGLGLATVYGVVKQSQGYISVESAPDEGSTFRIYFPHYEEKAVTDKVPEVVHQPPSGSETILLVEDEPALLKLAAWQLERLGYHVLPAGSPKRALEVARQFPGEIQLLVTDVIMPEMNGRDLWQKLSADHPRMKSLFISGYTADVIATRGILDEGVHFLQKPFTKAGLAQKVREALQGD